MPKSSKSMRDISCREDRNEEELAYRTLTVRSDSLNIEARTIDTVVSTETPVLMPDFERREMIPEVLLTSGVEYPSNRQVPFLDSHNRKKNADQFGSARSIKNESNQVVATLHFSRKASAEDAWNDVKDGHSTDVSAGYHAIKTQHVKRGETAVISGRTFEGPVNVVTKWKLREVSLTPIGADEQAKLRGLDLSAANFLKGDFEMNKELRALLVSRGMAATLTDEEAQVWLVKNHRALGDPTDPPVTDPPVTPPADPPAERSRAAGNQTPSTADFAKMIAEATRAAIAEERTRTANFNREVDSLCELAGLPEQAEACRALADVAAVRTHLLTVRKTATETIGLMPSVRITGEGTALFLADVGSALTQRALDQIGTPAPDGVLNLDAVQKRRADALEKVFPKAAQPKGAEQWRNASMYDIAEEMCKSLWGINTRGMARNDVATIAMVGPIKARELNIQFRSSGAAYHQTGSFVNLTLDAQNKSMMLGYTEAPSTWEGPMKRAASVDDFKNVNRFRLGSISNLPVWNDNDVPQKASMADAKETYAVESRSLELDFSYRLLVNDDMGVLGPAPAQLGAAARRTVNTFAWSLITANPTMSDGQALFSTATGNRKRANLITGSAVPTNLTLQTMTNQMMQMRGENTPEGNESADILSLMPRYIVGPGNLKLTIQQLVTSAFDPVASTFQVYNPSTMLIPVIEPLLDISSTTAWYLFADPSQIDTCEIAFLKGQESPILRSEMNYRTLSQSSIILQTFGGAPMNHRGIQKHAGV